MHGMSLVEGDVSALKELPHFSQMVSDFEHRANDRAFAAVRFSIYLHFALFFHQKPKLVMELIQYGADKLFPRLNWVDRIALMEACWKFDLPFADKVTLKVALQVILDPYYLIVL